MMYGNKLAAAIKVNGKVLREFKDTVYIPFGSEYSILVKNLNTVRVIVNIFLDGDNVVPGGLVLNALQEVDLERWIKNGNMSEGNRFKFIERTSAIENGPRGIKLEDGLIRIEYNFEKIPEFATNPFVGYRDLLCRDSYDTGRFLKSAYTTTCSTAGGAYASNATTAVAQNASLDSMVNQVETRSLANDVGITVPGSKSEQKFQTVSSFPTETQKHSLVLRLLGETEDNKPVEKPVTVKAKPKCTSCGKVNKANSKFCSECGTGLVIYG
jgi:hypothetical protein